MKKKAIIFDCFGVIISNVMGNWFIDHIGRTLKDKEEFSRLASLQDTGQASEWDINIELAKQAHSTPEIVEKEIESYFKVNEELVVYIKELKERGYKLAILTNASHDFFDRKVYVQCPWFKEVFDCVVISSLIKMVKPNPDIYEHALQKLGVKASEAVFTDDGKKNVLGGQNAGIDSILFTDIETFKKDLENILQN